MKHYENIQVEVDSGAKDKLRVFAFNNGRLTFTEALLKLIELQENQPR